MTLEQRLWRRVRRVLNNPGPYRCHLVRVENALDSGTPDVSWAISYSEGWLELKVARYPIRSNGSVNIQMSPAQLAWWRKRAACGGQVHVMIWLTHDKQDKRLLDEHFLMTGETAATHHEIGFNVAELREFAAARWGPSLDQAELVAALTKEMINE